MAKVCLLFLLLAGLSLPGYTQKTIAVIGSSTAAGYGLYDASNNRIVDKDDNHDNDLPVNSWPNRLRRYYAGLGVLNGLHNFAIYGEDIYRGMTQAYFLAHPGLSDTRGPWDSENNIDKALGVSPDIIIINFPSNNYDFFVIDETMAALHEIYNEATADGQTVAYITTTQPRTSDGWNPIDPNTGNPNPYWKENREKLKAIRDRIVAEFPNNYIDFYTPLVDATATETDPNYLGIKPEYAQTNVEDPSQLDGTHINDAGTLQLFNAVLAKNIIPIAPLPLKVGSLHVKRVDDTHINVTFTVLEGNTEKEFFIWVKDKAGNTKSVRVIIPDKTKASQDVSETIQIY
jgi:lysophospholipase L1-like esterase